MFNIIILIIVNIIGVLIGIVLSFLYWIKIVNQIDQNINKVGTYYQLFYQWLVNHCNENKILTYFKNNGYERIAIYGIKEIGLLLIKELSNTGIIVEYVIDKNLDIIPEGFKGCSPKDDLPEVDAIVVTASYYFKEIKEDLKYTGYDIVSIEDIVYSKY